MNNLTYFIYEIQTNYFLKLLWDQHLIICFKKKKNWNCYMITARSDDRIVSFKLSKYRKKNLKRIRILSRFELSNKSLVVFIFNWLIFLFLFLSLFIKTLAKWDLAINMTMISIFTVSVSLELYYYNYWPILHMWYVPSYSCNLFIFC